MLPHHGEIVEKIVRREGPSLTDLAKLMNVNRRSIYNWFIQQRLKPETILRIGRAMKHDFSVEFPELFISNDFANEICIKEELGGFEDWKEKYVDLLERYNNLLEYKDLLTSNNSPKYNVILANPNSNNFKLRLNNAPSLLFLDRCQTAGYKVMGVNQG